MARLKEIEHEDIFSSKTMANLKGKSGESHQSLLGDEDLMQTMQKTSALLPQILQAEEGYTDELETLAVQMVEEKYPIIPFMKIKIDAKKVVQFKSEADTMGIMPFNGKTWA